MNSAKYYIKFKFTEDQIKNYINSAVRDLKIAQKNDTPEVKFTFSYNALLKAGLAIIAHKKGLKIRSVRGHHS